VPWDPLSFNSSLIHGYVGCYHQFHTPSQSLLYPTFAFVFASIAGVEPQVLEAWELFLGGIVVQEFLIPSWSKTLALWT